MVICKFCGQEMTTADGCVKIQHNFKDEEVLNPVKYGDKKDREGLENTNKRCHDCNCKIGEYHHPGCDIERCPRCKGQSISCDCEKK